MTQTDCTITVDTDDARIYYINADTWAEARDAEVATTSSTIDMPSGKTYENGQYDIYRGFYIFPTAVLPDNCIIISASINVYRDNGTGNCIFMKWGDGESAYVININAFNDWTEGVAVTAPFAVPGSDQWVSVPLNGLGVSLISKSASDVGVAGETGFILMEYDHDYLNVPQPNGTNDGMYTHGADNANKPFLRVIHTKRPRMTPSVGGILIV